MGTGVYLANRYDMKRVKSWVESGLHAQDGVYSRIASLEKQFLKEKGAEVAKNVMGMDTSKSGRDQKSDSRK